MQSLFFEQQILSTIDKARKDTEWNIRHSQLLYNPENELRRAINENFSSLNFFEKSKSKDATFFYVYEVKLDKIYEVQKSHSFEKSIVGSAFIAAGQPILKKRFVMAGSAAGTSIASKFLSSALPQVMPTRILGTKVLGRAIGRAVPYVGWALLIIDVVELIIEEITEDNRDTPNFRGFGGGGAYGGGGASGTW